MKDLSHLSTETRAALLKEAARLRRERLDYDRLMREKPKKRGATE